MYDAGLFGPYVPDGMEEAYEEKLELELLVETVILLLEPGATYMCGVQDTPAPVVIL